MNLNEDEKRSATPPEENGKKKKLSRKEKKALKKAEKQDKTAKKEKPSAAAEAKKTASKTGKPVEASHARPGAAQKPNAPGPEEAEAHLEPAPVHTVPPPKYTLWEKISPPARRKRQIANMETASREVLGLVQAMRVNQEQLLESFRKLPEAVDSVKKLADHSAQQSELLKVMNEHMVGPEKSAGKFTDTLASMDRTTQLLLERAQRSEERLYGMIRRAQRRIAFMTILVLLLFFGAVIGGLFVMFPEESNSFLRGDGWNRAPSPMETIDSETVEDLDVIPTPLQVETEPAETIVDPEPSVDTDTETAVLSKEPEAMESEDLTEDNAPTPIIESVEDPTTTEEEESDLDEEADVSEDDTAPVTTP